MRQPFPAILVLLVGIAHAQQLTWVQRPIASGADFAGMAYDQARQRTVLVAGEQTFEWQGGRWTARATTPNRYFTDGSFSYDSMRRVCVLVSGATWEYDGLTWQARPGLPPALAAKGAFDPLRARTVSFGGYGPPTGYVDDTSEWDGTAWTVATAALRPPARVSHALAFDPANQAALLFGGFDGFSLFDDTWHWNGATWQQATPAARPSPRRAHAMALDTVRNRIVLFGGLDPSQAALADTWEWDGSTWSPAAPASWPSPRGHAAMAFEHHTARMLLFGGERDSDFPRDTWSWDGSQWQLLADGLHWQNLGDVTADTVRRELVAFGASPHGIGSANDTWIGDGTNWRRANPTTSPPPRIAASLAFDAARQQVLLFSGLGAPADTWTWSGTTWTAHVPAARPSAGSHPMAYDPTGQRVLLCESRPTTGVLDVWAWDGTNWSVQPAAVRPPPRFDPSVGFDTTRQRLVLFGGNRSCGFACITNLADTWLWDGGTWALAATSGPSPRSDAEMVDDPHRGRLVMVAGSTLATSPQIYPTVWQWPVADAWEWDGNAWTSLGLSHNVFTSPQAAFHPTLERVVLLNTGMTLLTDTPASSQAYGSGCAAGAGQPWITSSSPVLGSASFAIDVGNVPAIAPAIVGLSLSSAAIPIGAGCDLLLGPPISIAFRVANASGFIAHFVPVPASPVLRGSNVHAQALALDPSAPLGLIMTAGLRFTLGD